MKRVHRHEVDGEIVEVPLCWNKQLQQETEDDEGYLGQPAYTPAGRPILLTIEDACPDAAGASGGPAGPSNRAFAVPKSDFL